MKHLKTIAASVGVALATPFVALATNPFQSGQQMVSDVGGKAGISGGGGLTDIIGNLINIFLGFLGLVFLVLMLYAGFQWMTAGGDEGKVKKAREVITQAIIGLIVVVAAYAISSFVLGSLFNATQ